MVLLLQRPHRKRVGSCEAGIVDVVPPRRKGRDVHLVHVFAAVDVASAAALDPALKDGLPGRLVDRCKPVEA
jgi:hypothetical protein